MKQKQLHVHFRSAGTPTPLPRCSLLTPQSDSSDGRPGQGLDACSLNRRQSHHFLEAQLSLGRAGSRRQVSGENLRALYCHKAGCRRGAGFHCQMRQATSLHSLLPEKSIPKHEAWWQLATGQSPSLSPGCPLWTLTHFLQGTPWGAPARPPLSSLSHHTLLAWKHSGQQQFSTVRWRRL